jgi:transcriptional regulator with PAS, ATPase and Fis domain
MSKILISWEGYKEDFATRTMHNEVQREFKTNQRGPTFSLHKDFEYDYDKHILLNTSKSKEDLEFSKLLVKELNLDFPKHNVVMTNIELNDPLDIAEIFQVTNGLLNELKHTEVEAFISTGFPNMRVAWILAHANFKQNLKLFQIREGKYTKSKRPEKVFVNTDNVSPNAINVIGELVNEKLSGDKFFQSASIEPIYLKAKSIAMNTKDLGCLILGENGVGKENLASFIHQSSDRAKQKFVAVNCAAYSDELLRSELFGHEKGSFSGAVGEKKGMFQIAHGGTIFLDEIGDISPKMQVSLLRAIQEKKILRVGGTNEIDVDVRVIAATNKDLEDLCDKEIFRWDLFFRLAVTTLKLPALRDWTKKEKIDLIEHFNSIYFSEFPNRQQKLEFSKEVIDCLTSYHFKGNIRELQNLILSLYTFCDKEVTISDLPDRIIKDKKHPQSYNENEKAHILKVLTDKKWNIKLSSETLGIARETLYRKIKDYELKKPNKK